jgi:hypothetical protein
MTWLKFVTEKQLQFVAHGRNVGYFFVVALALESAAQKTSQRRSPKQIQV